MFVATHPLFMDVALFSAFGIVVIVTTVVGIKGAVADAKRKRAARQK